MRRACAGEADEQARARAAFPRGLVQPEGAWRFSLDALLLAGFAARLLEERAAGRVARSRPGASAPAQPRPCAALELGAGCGAALLGLALRRPELTGLGLEREPALVAAARDNADRLGLAERLRFRIADIGVAATGEPGDAGRDMVLANPPWGLPGHGRRSPRPLREAALRGEGDALALFARAAARLLRHHGDFCLVTAADTLVRLCAALDAAGLGLRRILPVRPLAGRPARRLLVLARKGAAHEPRLLAPLTLHRAAPAHEGSSPRWTAAARAFCPWLAAGAEARGGSEAQP